MPALRVHDEHLAIEVKKGVEVGSRRRVTA
jgi:hypothetical protein